MCVLLTHVEVWLLDSNYARSYRALIDSCLRVPRAILSVRPTADISAPIEGFQWVFDGARVGVSIRVQSSSFMRVYAVLMRSIRSESKETDGKGETGRERERWRVRMGPIWGSIMIMMRAGKSQQEARRIAQSGWEGGDSPIRRTKLLKDSLLMLFRVSLSASANSVS